jgi:hypothetical protein
MASNVSLPGGVSLIAGTTGLYGAGVSVTPDGTTLVGVGVSLGGQDVPANEIYIVSYPANATAGGTIDVVVGWSGASPSGLTGTWNPGGISATVSDFELLPGQMASATFSVPESDDTFTLTVTGVGSNTADATTGSIIVTGVAYVGPGDIVSGADIFYGLRAYNSAAAVPGTTQSINVRRASDNTVEDILILSSGSLNVAAAADFAGVDATGLGAIAGTALTFAGGHIGDTVTGADVSPGTYIASGSSPTWTVNISQTVASTELTLTWGLYVTTIYDQISGNNVSQTSASEQPQLLLSGGNNDLPCLSMTGSQGIATSTGIDIAQPITASTVVSWATSGEFPVSFAIGAELETNITFYHQTSSNVVGMGHYGVDGIEATASDGAFHSFIGIMDTTSSQLIIDGAATPGSLTDTNPDNTNISIGQASGGLSQMNGLWQEAVAWPVLFSGPQVASLHTNQAAYWGTP